MKHLLLLILFALSPLNFAAEPIQYRVLIQVSEDSLDRLQQALKNATNIMANFGPEHVEVQIIVIGNGVKTLQRKAPFPVPDQVKALKHQGVRIVADKKAMQRLNLKPADMLTEVYYVESGLVEIVEKQYQGWAYVRP